MDFSRVPLFSMIGRSLDWITRNHEVLAENVANADTPEYLAQELKPVHFDRIVRASVNPVNIRQTASRHLAGTTRPDGPFRIDDTETPYEVTPTGNAVNLEEQAMLVAKNSMDYELITTLYRKNLGLFKIALGRDG